MHAPLKWIDRAGQRRSLDKLALDLNSSVRQTYGRRERAADQRRREAPCAASICWADPGHGTDGQVRLE